jgi:hypothetical protein
MGDAGCLLFQDIPNNRTMRWIDGLGASIYRAPSNYANGQTRDRQAVSSHAPIAAAAWTAPNMTAASQPWWSGMTESA